MLLKLPAELIAEIYGWLGRDQIYLSRTCRTLYNVYLDLPVQIQYTYYHHAADNIKVLKQQIESLSPLVYNTDLKISMKHLNILELNVKIIEYLEHNTELAKHLKENVFKTQKYMT